MLLESTRVIIRHKILNRSIGPSYFLTHDTKQVDQFKGYNSQPDKSDGSTSSYRNLFDDTDNENKKWLKIAKGYLRKVKKI